MGSSKFINQEIRIYQFVSVDHNSMVMHLTSTNWMVFRSAVYPMQWMTLMMICCGMAMKRMGMLAVNVRKIKALAMKMEAVTLIGKSR
jgi:hypothetical protein